MEEITELITEEDKKAMEDYITMSLGKDLLALSPYEIETQYPLAYKACIEYMSKKAEVPLNQDIIVSVFIYSPNIIMYRFFDDQEIYINIRGQKDEWNYSINEKSSSILHKRRVLAEEDAIKYAFLELNNKLKPK